MHLKLAQEGVVFATRPRAQSIVEQLRPESAVDLFVVDLHGVEAASPAFLDELLGQLSERYRKVDISGASPYLVPLLDRVIARRGLESRFRVTAEA